MQLLLDGRFAPITSEVGFLEAECADVAAAFAEWQSELQAGRGVTVSATPLAGDIAALLARVPPLCTHEHRRHLFVPTAGPWTAFFDNGRRGTDAGPVARVLALRMKCRGLRVVAVPDTMTGPPPDRAGRYGAVIMELYGPEQTDFLNYLRSLSVANDGGKWRFDQAGEPLPFEDLERYQSKRKADRFNFEMLARYLRALGVEAFDAAFYQATADRPAVLVEKHGPTVPGLTWYSLEEANRRP